MPEVLFSFIEYCKRCLQSPFVSQTDRFPVLVLLCSLPFFFLRKIQLGDSERTLACVGHEVISRKNPRAPRGVFVRSLASIFGRSA